MEISLRDYQQDGIRDLYANFKGGIKRQIYVAPTGSGKSLIFAQLSIDANACGMNVVLIVKRRELIDQASGHFDKYGLDHGVHMAKHWRYYPSKKVQICSVDTLRSRGLAPYSDDPHTMIIIDEAHDCSSNTYRALFEIYKDQFIVGLTATPYSDNSMFETYVCSATAESLRDKGYLTPEKTYVPNIIDVSGVKKDSTGDFRNKELEAACSKSEVIGDVVKNWRKYGEERRTVLFAVNIEHSKLLTRSLNDAGIRAVHCDANSTSQERKDAIGQLNDHSIDVLCNVNIFSTGVDIPPIECISFCRPTHSVIYWLQALGRGLRPSPATGKKDCIIIDHAGNTYRHGGVYVPREISMLPKDRITSKIEGNIIIRTCEMCFYVYQNESCCPDCGHVNDKKHQRIESVDGELVEYKLSDEEIKKLKTKIFIKDFYKLKNFATIKKWTMTWVAEQMIKKHGLAFCRENYKLVNDFPVAKLI